MNRRELLGYALAAASLGDPAMRAYANNPEVSLVVDVTKTLGAAASIGDLIGSQYAPYTFDFRNPDPWGVQAWREVGFNISDIALFNFEGSNPFTDAGKIVGIHVRRRRDGKLQLDFRDFDENIRFLRQTLGVKKIDFTAWGTPKALADPAAGKFFFFHAPRDYKEWAEILRQAVTHIANDLGLAGSTYKPWTEPDTGWYWRGHARPGEIVTGIADAARVRETLMKDPRILRDYVEKYVTDWRLIKAVDPTAKVSGTFNVYSKRLVNTLWSVDEFLDEIDHYNAAHPGERVTVDEIAYQDYNWHGGGLAEGVIGANAAVTKHALPSTTPLVVVGWNNGMQNDQSLQQRAAYVVSNIMTELTPTGRSRTLSRAYLWPFDYDDSVLGLAPVVMPYQAVSYSGDDGVGDPLSIPAVTTYAKRPLHAGLKLLSEMKPGKLVTAHAQIPKVSALAALQPNGDLTITAANYDHQACRVRPALMGVRRDGRTAKILLQRIDATHSSDGSGLENGFLRTFALDASGTLPPIDMPPYSVIGITLKNG